MFVGREPGTPVLDRQRFQIAGESTFLNGLVVNRSNRIDVVELCVTYHEIHACSSATPWPRHTLSSRPRPAFSCRSRRIKRRAAIEITNCATQSKFRQFESV